MWFALRLEPYAAAVKESLGSADYVFNVAGLARIGTFKDTPLGKCILNAMANVVVPPFSGADHVIDWEIDLDAKDEGGEGE